MDIYNFSGTYYEIGKQQGEIYKKRKSFLKSVKINKKIYDKQYEIYKKYYPEILDEFRGISDSTGYKFENIFYGLTLCSKMSGCSIFGTKTSKGTYIGRNYDWTKKGGSGCIFSVKHNDKNSFVSISDNGVEEDGYAKKYHMFFGMDFINNKKLYIGLTYFHCDKKTFGLSMDHYMRLISEKCETVSEVLDIIKVTPLSEPKNFFISDKNGDMITVEHTTEMYKVIYPKDDIVIHTNHALSKHIEKFDTINRKYPYHDSYVRYYEILMLLQTFKKNINLSKIKNKILMNPKSYTYENFKTYGTLWSLIINWKRKEAIVYYKHNNKTKSVDLLKILVSIGTKI